MSLSSYSFNVCYQSADFFFISIFCWKFRRHIPVIYTSGTHVQVHIDGGEGMWKERERTEGEGEGETEGRAGRKSGQDEDTDGR